MRALTFHNNTRPLQTSLLLVAGMALVAGCSGESDGDGTNPSGSTAGDGAAGESWDVPCGTPAPGPLPDDLDPGVSFEDTRWASVEEAREVVREIAGLAIAAFERQGGKLCETSALTPPFPPPAAIYQSAPSDWEHDEAWTCLGFSRTEPQYYADEYRATGHVEFTATALGDVDGDGDPSTFTLTGEVIDGAIVLGEIVEMYPCE